MSTTDTPRRWYVPTGPFLGLLAVFVLFTALISVKGELANFLSVRNAQVLVHEATIPAAIALGMLLILITGGIDLSVGSVVALVTVVTMQVYRRQVLSDPEAAAAAGGWAVMAGLATGGLCGLINGLLITQLCLPPFVATLGMLGIAKGLAIGLAGRTLIAFPGEQPGWVGTLQQVHPPVGLFSPGFWSVIVLAGLTAVLLHRTVLGRHIFAIGSNEATARLCGVAVGRTKIIVYTLAGLLTGWAGILTFAHGASGDPSAGEGLELQVIAAVVIGGARLGGGRGTVTGTLLGVLILGLLANGVSLFDVPVEMQYLLVGVIIVVNAALSGREREGE